MIPLAIITYYYEFIITYYYMIMQRLRLHYCVLCIIKSLLQQVLVIMIL